MKKIVLLIMLLISASRVNAVVLPSEITTDQIYGDTVEVTSVVSIKDGAKVTFNAGTVFKMNDGCRIYVRLGSEIHLNGTESDSIRFISASGNTKIPAIFINGVDTSTISYCKFDAFYSVVMGISGSENVTIEHSTFSNNPQALQFYESSGSINSCDFIGNIALNKSYSALQITKSSNVSVKNSTFKGNGSEVASAIDIWNSSLTIENAVIENNSSTLHGGAIRFDSATDDSLKIITTSVTNNSGGGVFTTSGNVFTSQLTSSANSSFDKNFSSEDEVWQDSVKFNTDSYVILSSSNITVKPGTTLFSSKALTLNVLGNLSLAGSALDSIYLSGKLSGITYQPSTSSKPVEITFVKVAHLYKNNRAVIEISGRNKLEISHSLFYKNSAAQIDSISYGSALYIKNTPTTINACSFVSNNATSSINSYGGAIYSEKSSIYITASTFLSNKLVATNKAFGSDIYSLGGDISVENSTFSKSNINTKYGFGASIAIYNGSLSIIGGLFKQPSAQSTIQSNGMVYSTNSSVFLQDVTFDSTYSYTTEDESFGALHINNGNLEVIDSKFSNNSITSTDVVYGSAIYKKGNGFTKITGTIFTNNKASKNKNNSGGAYGGAIYINDELTIIKDCSFENNSASASAASRGDLLHHYAIGGAAYIRSTSFLVENSQFINNNATLNDYDAMGDAIGGALYLQGNGNVNQCTISNNSAISTSQMISTYNSIIGSTGGAIRVSSGKVSINNSLLFDNWVSSESFKQDYPTGDILSSDTPLTVRNCTIAGTTKGDNAINATIEAYNTIFAIDNSLLSVSSKVYSKIFNSVFTQDNDFVSINGNIKVNPQFIDSANGNYALKSTSPLINSGDNSAIYGSADINGNARIVGSKVDIGAFEYGANAIDIADDKKANTIQDIAVTIPLSSKDGATIFNILTAPQGGSVKIVGSTLTYTPFDNFSGVDFLTYYPVTSTGIKGAQATVSINVANLNDAPVAIGGIVEIMKNGGPAEFYMTGTDFEGGYMADYIIVDSTTNGSYLVSTSHRISYTPNLDFIGIDSLTFQVVDDSGSYSKLATITFIVKEPTSILDNKKLIEINNDLVSIYPNPVIDVAHIETKLTGDSYICNDQGKKIAPVTDNKFDATKLPKGIYYIVIENKNRTEAIKIFYKM